MDDVPAGGAIPPPSKPNTTSANLTLLHNLAGRQTAAAVGLHFHEIATRRIVVTVYNVLHVHDDFWCDANRL